MKKQEEGEGSRDALFIEGKRGKPGVKMEQRNLRRRNGGTTFNAHTAAETTILNAHVAAETTVLNAHVAVEKREEKCGRQRGDGRRGEVVDNEKVVATERVGTRCIGARQSGHVVKRELSTT